MDIIANGNSSSIVKPHGMGAASIKKQPNNNLEIIRYAFNEAISAMIDYLRLPD